MISARESKAPLAASASDVARQGYLLRLTRWPYGAAETAAGRRTMRQLLDVVLATLLRERAKLIAMEAP